MTADTPSPAQDWLDRFSAAIGAGDVEATLALFGPDCFWRDLVALSWNIVTAEGPAEVQALLEHALATGKPGSWTIDHSMASTPAPPGVDQFWATFETPTGRGSAMFRLRNGKAWTVLTALGELRGHEEPTGDRRPFGVEHGAVRGRRTWREKLDDHQAAIGATEQPYVLIVGGGQGGIALGARLRQLGVPAVIVDRHPAPGDAWRKRYRTLCLHDPVWYDHLPYLPFPENWPVYTPKDKMGDWLEAYVDLMELDYWPSTTCDHAEWDATTGRWQVELTRDGQPVEVEASHVVIATGLAGRPHLPEITGMETFEGDQHHSTGHPGPDAYAGKRAVVVGSNNSAHDIAAALWEVGADVTMLQRSSSLVVTVDSIREIGQAPLYSEAAVRSGISTNQADLTFASIPHRLMPQFQIPTYERIKEVDKDFYAALEQAGFMLDFGEDGSGVWLKYLAQNGGYYIDVGASQLVIDDKIHLRSPANIDRIEPDGVMLATGEKLSADLIVYATGFGPYGDALAELTSPEVAERVGPVWGIGSGRRGDPGPWEGELRNMWKPTGQDGLWFHGGNLAQSRLYSRYLALQLKARFEGIPTPIFGKAALGPASS